MPSFPDPPSLFSTTIPTTRHPCCQALSILSCQYMPCTVCGYAHTPYNGTYHSLFVCVTPHSVLNHTNFPPPPKKHISTHLVVLHPPSAGDQLSVPCFAAAHTRTPCLLQGEWRHWPAGVMVANDGAAGTMKLSMNVHILCNTQQQQQQQQHMPGTQQQHTQVTEELSHWSAVRDTNFLAFQAGCTFSVYTHAGCRRHRGAA